MGTKYSSQSTSGYNSSPPVGDGTASEANKVKWSTIKTKLADVLKTFGEAINTALVTAFDQSCRTVTASDSAAATDHNRTIQVTTSSVTITLADATTMAAGYIVSVANQSSGDITVALATSTDTIDGVTNTTHTITTKETRRYIVNTAATGYITSSCFHPSRPVLATEQATTSGTAINFTSIPAWAKKIILQFVGVSTSGTNTWLIQLGSSGGLESTNYLGAGSSIPNGSSPSVTNFTAGFGVEITSAAAVVHGAVVLTLEDAAGFTWVANGGLSRSDAAIQHLTHGSKSLAAALDRLTLTTTGGTDTFDAGAINILYE